jgi:threonine aldolase
MAAAEVGDDEYGEDPTVNALQEAFAERVGKAAALFVPSGTMANQVAFRLLTRPGDVVVAGGRQHVVIYEHGAAAQNAGVQFHTVPDDDGIIDRDDLKWTFEAIKHHHPRVGLISIENTHMPANGVPWPLDKLQAVADLARNAGVPIHQDGARLWNAEVATGVSMARYAECSTTVMCCLSKGLCAPVGSVLAGPADVMESAREERGRLGGGMRQAGVIAAAGLVAMRTMVERLAEDHHKASRLAEAVAERWPDGGCDPSTVPTNIVTFRHPNSGAVLAHLRAEGVVAGMIAPGVVRLVAHHDVNDDGIRRACKAIANAP